MLNLHRACLMITLHIKCSIFHPRSSIHTRIINVCSDFHCSIFYFRQQMLQEIAALQDSVKHMRNVIHLHTDFFNFLLPSFEVASIASVVKRALGVSTAGLKNLVKLRRACSGKHQSSNRECNHEIFGVELLLQSTYSLHTSQQLKIKRFW